MIFILVSELVKWILSLNPSAVNVGNSFGRTSLHLASQTNSVQLCKLLIDCGASVGLAVRSTLQAHTSGGWTALS